MRDLPFFPTGSAAGDSGKDGISPTISVIDIEGGHRITIVDAIGTKTIDILDGVKGPQGIQGIQGPKGDKGDKGDTGPQGLQGEKGDKGDTGPQGMQGLPGEKGDQGPIGLTGPQGPQGETGAAGPQGSTGQDGKDGVNGRSAFEYAQDGGYTGAETDFSELLANIVDKRTISLGVHTDGLLYIFINGEPIGTGVILNTNTEA